jgi:hypothetical protein
VHRQCAPHPVFYGPVQWSRKGASHRGLRLEQHAGFPLKPTHRIVIGIRHKLDNELASVQGMAIPINVSILSLPDLRSNTAHVHLQVMLVSIEASPFSL